MSVKKAKKIKYKNISVVIYKVKDFFTLLVAVFDSNDQVGHSLM